MEEGTVDALLAVDDNDDDALGKYGAGISEVCIGIKAFAGATMAVVDLPVAAGTAAAAAAGAPPLSTTGVKANC